MNMQDIADFISLVKDPEKFEKALKEMQEEQDRWKAVVATVGKASELDSLRKKLEKETAKKLLELDAKIADVDIASKQSEAQTQQLRQALQLEVSKMNRMQNEAFVAEVKAKELQASFSGRDKVLRVEEARVAELQTSLGNSLREYEEKLAKLRTVMN